ncbi:MAG: RNA polymerase sigma factor [Burkholderiaceae bacterium]|nr:MAG: RNA polymerase sigma factor [Burkholderiaceae bacterium]
MAHPKELDHFLAAVEGRAFKTARYATRNDDAALDIVQEAMIKLAQRYGDRPVEELGPLFMRILNNCTNDYFRRNKVRSFWVTLFSALPGQGDDDSDDPLESLQVEDGSAAGGNPEQQLEQAQILKAIEGEIEKLPARQRQAFLMRYWEELDVAETAAVMGCSEGSVKTHCSRATHTLSAALLAKGIKL